jgi:hypothetical protein
VDAQSGSSLKVIVNNERRSGEVCVSSASETLPCKYVNSGESEEFQFSTNAVLEGEEFKACLEGLCQTGVFRLQHLLLFFFWWLYLPEIYVQGYIISYFEYSPNDKRSR